MPIPTGKHNNRNDLTRNRGNKLEKEEKLKQAALHGFSVIGYRKSNFYLECCKNWINQMSFLHLFKFSIKELAKMFGSLKEESPHGFSSAQNRKLN